MIYLIVGLGNIGDQYTNTRHNVGWRFLDYLNIENYQFTTDSKLKSSYVKLNYLNSNFFLIKPTTFMNLSGIAVRLFADFYKIPVENILIVYDDIDLKLGEVRFRQEGSAGTHNGMKSVIEHFGEKIPRLRIGIENRTEEQLNIPLSDYVLNRFTIKEETELKTIFEKGMQIIENKFIKNA